MSRPPHQVIYTHGGGRLGNQVIRFAHWIAWARANPGIEIVNFAFWPFAACFARWRDQPGCTFPERTGRADRWARRLENSPRLRALGERRQLLPRFVQSLGRWRSGWQAIDLDVRREEQLDLDDPAVAARVRQRPVTTCCGWRIASWRLFTAQAQELREFFRPAADFATRAEAFIAGLRRTHDVVIGVFIRQSDYRVWHDGRFCFPAGTYATWMRQLLDLHAGRRVAFVIASEERQDPAAFAGLPVHFATGSVNAGGHWFESWAELALCDSVVSPPSTFSATAAWIGGVPLWPVVAANQGLEPKQMITDGLAGAARHPEFSLAVK